MSNKHTQWYIGAPNGVVLCIHSIHGKEPAGQLYHSYQTEPVLFDGYDEMTHRMEALYDALRFPHPATNQRSFTPPQTVRHILERNKIMSDEQLLSKHGDIGTFIVRVQHRQNSSWQGRLTWMEKDQTLNFRSVWEMIKLIESAVDTVSIQEDKSESEASWNLTDDAGADE